MHWWNPETDWRKQGKYFPISACIKISKKQKQKAGRPKKTTKEMDNFIVDNVEQNRKLLPKQVQKMVVEKYGVRLSLSQIWLRLRVAGLHGAVCVRKTFVILGKQAEEIALGF